MNGEVFRIGGSDDTVDSFNDVCMVVYSSLEAQRSRMLGLNCGIISLTDCIHVHGEIQTKETWERIPEMWFVAADVV